ncbi:MAG: helix-hairpin-helix domain-containing protein [Candidatus Omnitrophica bacterium]|nr:helix-hairpin-helix domain-containing protein [Candidatus Omnitrophota bacterium]
MLGLTPQERKTIIFLISIALFGLGIKFISNNNPYLSKITKADNQIARIDINRAGLQDLLRTQRISPKLAGKIIGYRQERGRLKSIDELKDIKGIGEYRFQKLKDLFFVE